MNTPIRTTGLSPDARDLLERTLKWLEPKGRWHKGWGILRDKKTGDEYEIHDKDDFRNETWRDYWDEKVGDYRYPFENYSVRDVKSACALGALLVNNNGAEDEVFEEAARALADLVIDSKLKDDPDYLSGRDYYDYGLGVLVNSDEHETRLCMLENEEEREELVMSFNDAEDSDATRVKNLFRRVLGRRTY